MIKYRLVTANKSFPLYVKRSMCSSLFQLPKLLSIVGFIISILTTTPINAQTTILSDSGTSHTNTDGTTLDSYGPVDITNCTSIRFEVDYSFSLAWEGFGNMEMSSECVLCAGDPTNPSGGGCNQCWDFIWIQYFIDGAQVSEKLVGADGTTDADQSGEHNYLSCVDGRSEASIEIRTQTWAANETVEFGPITILCWEGAPEATANPDPICENEILNLEATVGDNSVLVSNEWTGPGTIDDPFSLITTARDFSFPSADYTITCSDVNSCEATDNVSVNVDQAPFANPAGPLEECGTGQAIFELTSLDITIGGGDPVEWYEDIDLNFPIFDPSGYTSGSTTVYAVVVGSNGCLSEPEPVELIVSGQAADICDPGTLRACLRIDGTGEFNLSAEDNVVNCGTGFTVNWYEDAGGTQLITDPSAFVYNFGTPPGFPIIPPSLDGEVYAQVVDNNGCESQILEIDLRAVIGPAATLDPNPLFICVDPQTGEGEVDVEPYNTQIITMGGEVQWWGWEGFPSLPFFIGTGGTVDVNPPATLYGIYVDNDDCIYVPSELEVRAHPVPDVNDPLDQRICGDENGEAIIDLTAIAPTVGNGDVQWYEDDQLDIQIFDPANYTVFEGTQTIYVVNVDPATGCRSDIEDMVITVDAFPFGNPVGPFSVCSEPGTESFTVDLTENDQGIIGGTTNSVDWFIDEDATMPIPDPTNFTVMAPSTVVYAQVIGPDPLNCPGEIIEVEYIILLTPLAIEPLPVDICIPADTNVIIIDLTQYNELIHVGGGTVLWFTDPGATLPIPDPENYQATIPLQDVFARVEENGCLSNIVPLIFNPLPSPEANPAMLEACDDGSGLGIYDLTQIIDEINGGSGDDVRFFEEFDGEGLFGEITDLEEYETDLETIYAIVDNGECQSSVVAIQLLLIEQAFLNDIGPFSVCPDADGTATIDLTAYDDDLLGNQTGIITWFEDDQFTEIDDPENFVINGPVTVSARAGDGTNCPSEFVDVNFSLSNGVSYEAPNNPYLVCVDPATGQADVDLRNYLDSIYSGNGNAIWQTTAGDTITNDSMHTVTPLDSIFLSIIEGTCATDTLILFTFAERPPIDAQPAALSACDNGDGTADFDLTTLGPTINIGSGLNVEFFEDQALTTPITNPDNYNSGSVTVYAIVLDGNCSSNVVEITLTVQQSAQVCADEFDFCSSGGMITVDLNSLNDSVNCGDGSMVTWYLSDMADPANEITQPLVISVLTEVYVVVGSGTCATAPTLITLNILQAPEIAADTLRACADPAPASFDLISIENSVNSGSGLPVSWFEDGGATTPIADPSAFEANDTTEVFAFVSDGTCNSDTVAIILEVIETPGFEVPVIDTCGDANGNLLLDLTLFDNEINSSGTIIWYEDVNGMNIIADPNNYNASTGSIFARVNVAGCLSPIFEVPLTIRICNCNTAAPELTPSALDICLPGDASVDTLPGTLALAPGDDWEFVIHDGSAAILGAILDRNTSGSFAFDNRYNPGQTYFIHAIAGPVDANGDIDTNDDCFDISNTGIPVRFFTPAGIDTLPIIEELCPGDSFTLTLNFDVPGVSYSFELLNERTTQSQFFTTGPLMGNSFDIVLSPDQTTTYRLIDLNYGVGIDCPGSAEKSITIEVIDELNVIRQDVRCITDSTYIVEIIVTGGGGPDDIIFNPSSTHGGNFINDSLFISDPIPSDERSVFQFNGACNLNSNIQVPEQDCSNPCTTNAGQISVDTTQACENEIINVIASGNQLDNDDLVFFVVHEQPDLLSSNLRIVQSNRQIEFDPAMNLGQDYYVTMVVGNGMPNGGFDEDDPCLDLSNTVVIRFLPTVQLSLVPLNSAICLGDSLKLRLELGGLDSVDITLDYPGGRLDLNDVSDGDEIRLYSEQTGNWGISQISGATGCFELSPSVPVSVSDLSANLLATTNFNGFEVSCGGLSDGGIIIQTNNGIQPFTFTWSDGGTGIEREMLPAGNYQVIVSDNAGCVDTANITLSEPPPIMISGFGENPGCFGGDNGSITVDSIQGGSGNYTLYLNGFEMNPIDQTQLPYTIDEVSAGIYEVGVLDGNNCYGFFDLTLTNPPERPININRSSLPGDSIVSLGQTLQLEVQSTFTYDSVTWTTDFEIECLNPPLCDLIRIQPTQTGEIAVEVQDDGGCTSRTSTLIRVSTALNVFVPEAFSPNGDGINDYFTIYSNQIESIQRLQIYDRWGNRLFIQENFMPGIENLGWDGTANEKELNPGVYIFTAEVIYLNGQERVVKGDVTLVK